MSTTVLSVWSPEPGLLSEGARWHEQREELLWVDILGRRLHRATLTRDGHPGRIETVELDRDVGVVAPAAAGGYVAAATLSFLFVDESGTVTELASLTDAPSGVRFNDGPATSAVGSGSGRWPTTSHRAPVRSTGLSWTEASAPC